jgi:elongation of very long chain fatty acids protein 1
MSLVLTPVLCFLYFYGTKNQSPFTRISISRLTIQLYNVIQIVFNTFMTWRIIQNSSWNLLFVSPERSSDILICNLYYGWRFVDWIDTLILFSQQKTPSSLHVIHHGSMPLLCWISTIFHGNFGSTLFSILLNSIIHAIMYSYYLVSSYFKFIQKWKYVLTKLQIIQFFLIALHTFLVLVYDPYQPSIIPGLARITYMVLMIVCFNLWYAMDTKRIKTLRHKN